MLIKDAPLQDVKFVRLPMISEKALIAILAATFMLLHILAGTILQRGAASETIIQHEDASRSLYD